jgi:hypothetical protein
MAKSRILIQGSSWTVGAYAKSSTPQSDDLVPGCLGDLLGDEYEVINLSMQDDFNLGMWSRLLNYSRHYDNYDKILICQNDPLRELSILRGDQDLLWRQQFNWTVDEIKDAQVDTITKLIHFFLDRYYSNLSKFHVPIYIIAGPTQVLPELTQRYSNLHAITPSWTEVLVPGFSGSLVETGVELEHAAELLMSLFPDNKMIIKQELIKYAICISDLLATWKDHPDLFAYHHPTALGNKLFYDHIKEFL